MGTYNVRVDNMNVYAGKLSGKIGSKGEIDGNTFGCLASLECFR